MKKGLLALVCLSMLVMTPACRKKDGGSDAKMSREHMRHQKKTTVVRVKTNKEPMKKEAPKKKMVKKEAPKKEKMMDNKPAKKMSSKKSGTMKSKGQRVGDRLKAEEVNPEDVD